MDKIIPEEKIIFLYNKPAALLYKNSDCKRLFAHLADNFGVSHSRVHRQLSQHVPFEETVCADKNKPKRLSQENMFLYCRLIAVLKIRTSNKNKIYLSIQACIRFLEELDLKIPQSFVKALCDKRVYI